MTWGSIMNWTEMELQLPSSIMGLECTPEGIHSQAEMMSDTSYRNNKGWVTHDLSLIPTPGNPLAQKLYLLDVIKWKYNGCMGYNDEELRILGKTNKLALRIRQKKRK